MDKFTKFCIMLVTPLFLFSAIMIVAATISASTSNVVVANEYYLIEYYAGFGVIGAAAAAILIPVIIELFNEKKENKIKQHLNKK
ncbi:MAG: hypothetical protein QXL51_04995 [Candidatus Aenigmatarchaeota archaeon]